MSSQTGTRAIRPQYRKHVKLGAPGVPGTDHSRATLVARLLIIAILGLLPAFARSGASVSSGAPLAFEDVNPNATDLSDPDGASAGRVNALASVSNDNQTFYAASEFGGIYKSTNGGVNWAHLDTYLPTKAQDIKVNPGNTGTVYATAFADGRATGTSIGGIQVSFDAGVTWSHPASAAPAPAYNCTAARRNNPNAMGIAVRPDATQNVFIGTNCGLARSSNGGITWTFVDPTPATPATAIWDVKVQAGGANGIIDVCGDDGHLRSTDGGAVFAATTGLPSGRCNIDVSPDESYVLFVFAADNNIYESDNSDTGAAATWTNLGTPDSRRQGRVPFVATNQRTGAAFDLWAGDVGVFRAGCTTPSPAASGGANRCPAGTVGAIPSPAPPTPAGWAGPFTRTAGAHDDVGDLVFDTAVAVDSCPRLLSSDGGIYRNTDTSATCPTPSWTQSHAGVHAQWLFSMSGVDKAGVTNEDLYYGLQDDGAWGTTTAGAPSPTWHNEACCDVFDTVGDPTRVVFDTCCQITPTGFVGTLWYATAGMTSSTQVPTAPPGGVPVSFAFPDVVDVFADKQYVVATSQGTFITPDITASPTVWNELGAATDPKGGSVRVSMSGGVPTFYRLAGGLFKYSGTATGGTWTRVDTNGLVGGISMFTVDRSNPNRLYAANTAPGGVRMVFSINGGLSWAGDANLDTLMNGNGAFNLTTVNDGITGPYSQPSLVAFDPQDANVLVAGGQDSGVFLSTNGGKNWALLTDPYNSNSSGIPHLQRPYYAYFDHEPSTPTKVYIGTQGRGVWRITLPTADVSVTKYDSPDPAIAGGQLYYTITAYNDGPDAATNVTINDVLPSQVKFITDDLGACVEAPVGTITCNLGTLANGDYRTVVVKVEVKPNTVANAGGPTSIQNVAAVSSSGAVDPDFSNNFSAVVGTIIEDSSDLRVTKVCKPDTKLLAGQTGTCTIYIDNLGLSDARNVRVTDNNLSIGSFTIGTVTTSQGTCSKAGGIVTCSLGTLPAASPTVLGRATIAINISANEEMDINDVATVVSDTPDPVTSNNEATGSISVQALSNLSIIKSALSTVIAGQTLTYTINLSNGGPSTARNVLIKDDLPAGVTVNTVGATGGPASCNAGVPGDPFQPTTCAFDSVAPSAGRTMTIVVKVKPQTTGILHNDARVSSDTLDADNSNDLAHTDTAVTAEAALVTTIAATPNPVVAGLALSYQITVANSGPSTATGVTLTDTLPPVLTFTSATASTPGGTCGLQVNTNIVQCQLGTLDPGQNAVVFIYTNVSPSAVSGSTITDSATALSPELVPGSNIGSVSTGVITSADLGITLASDKDVYKPSTVIHYTITVTNGGPSDAQSVRVTQLLPPVKTGFYISNNIGCPPPVGTTFTCVLGTIPAGGTRTFQLNYMIRGNKGTITSTASVASLLPTPDPNAVNNSSTRVVTVK